MHRKLSNYSIDEILAEDPYILLLMLKEEYEYNIPIMIETIDDLKVASQLLGKLAGAYSYLTQLSVSAKLYIRSAKRDKKSKDYIDDCIDRKAVIDTFTDAIQLQYKAISRMLTIKQQINEELKMTDGS